MDANTSFSPPISIDESVVAAHLATNDFFSARLLFYSNCQFFNPLNHLGGVAPQLLTRLRVATLASPAPCNRLNASKEVRGHQQHPVLLDFLLFLQMAVPPGREKPPHGRRAASSRLAAQGRRVCAVAWRACEQPGLLDPRRWKPSSTA